MHRKEGYKRVPKYVFLFITSIFSRFLLRFLVSFCLFKVYVLFTCDFPKTLPDFGDIEMDPTQSLSLKFQSDLTRVLGTSL